MELRNGRIVGLNGPLAADRCANGADAICRRETAAVAALLLSPFRAVAPFAPRSTTTAASVDDSTACSPPIARRRPAFEEGVSAIFTAWTALCLAVENGWGGAQSVDKANQIIQDIIDWFYAKKGALRRA